MSQEQHRDVRRKYYTKLRSCSHRDGESRPLDDTLSDHLRDRSRSVGPTNGGKGLQCCSLLRHLAIDAKAGEAIAKSYEGFVTLPCREREVSAPQELSGRRDRRPPRGHRRSAKHAVRLG